MALVQLGLPEMYAYKFNLFFDMAEKVYVDILSNRGILGCYTEQAREWEITQRRKEFINPPTVTELLHIWWKMAADRSGLAYKEEYVDRSVGGLTERTSLEKFYKKPVALLNSIVEQLKDNCAKISGVSERGNFRTNLYVSIWRELLGYIKFWPGDRADCFMLHDKFNEEIEKEEEEKKALKATIISYAEEIERHTTTRTVDFTDDVKSIVKNIEEVVRIEGHDIVMPAADKVDKKLLNNLQMVIKSATKRRVKYNRGLSSGKIDRRRLYRAPTTGTVFHLKKSDYELINNVVLLVDCTGSMAGPTKWDHAESIYQTLFLAIRTYNKKARLFGYNEWKETCRITELYLGGKFYSVLPHGKTASGEAIIATALSLKPGRKRPYIIHLTDGASNWGCGVKDAIKFCEEKKINILTLGLGCHPSNKMALREEYGKLVGFVDNLNELPRLLTDLLAHSKYK
jgi:hypothetical protein